ncbi:MULTISPECIES: hypothetical protein [Oceanibaculum]|uniref:Lipoprotein n=2 Tax=Oceanibaculum indicum TaxID=526216 RepID=K2IX17_9PROT|nr:MULTISPECIES: hypothetical protein [Oceanibaculum]EKE67438.1 hypothetical protein P24_18571 [Oceanibaculum indicum P24]MCH2396366.1 hypothetical protein [Oceanibaculum sp.]RKQ69942.1 hypothetical protein BCL74_1876 [Oceanibaculum indicum]
MKKTALKRGLAALAVLATVAGTPAVSFAACATPKESAALEARVLLSELMVAALSCNQRPSYNAVVTRYQGEMASTGKALKGYFARVHGARSAQELNGFVTRMANEASQRSLSDFATFCSAAEGKFAALMDERQPHNFERFAGLQPEASSHGVEVCQYTAANTASRTR